MSIEVAIAAATAAVGLYGVIKGVISSYIAKKNPKIKIEVADKVIYLNNLSKEDLEKIITKLQEGTFFLQR